MRQFTSSALMVIGGAAMIGSSKLSLPFIPQNPGYPLVFPGSSYFLRSGGFPDLHFDAG